MSSIGIPPKNTTLDEAALRDLLSVWRDDMRVALPVALVRQVVGQLDEARIARDVAIRKVAAVAGGAVVDLGRELGVDTSDNPSLELIASRAIAAAKDLRARLVAAEVAVAAGDADRAALAHFMGWAP